MENFNMSYADDVLRKKHILKISRGKKVFNKRKTSGLTCRCNGWLAHWRLYSGKDVALCVVNTCSNLATVGAHVVSCQRNGKVYIAPFCRKCNNSHNIKQMELDPNFPLVNADKGKLCRKQNAATRALIKKSPYLNERPKKKR